MVTKLTMLHEQQISKPGSNSHTIYFGVYVYISPEMTKLVIYVNYVSENQSTTFHSFWFLVILFSLM